MFGNFIYFIVVLLIYLTYQSPESIELVFSEAFLTFGALVFFYLFLAKYAFRRLEKSAAGNSLPVVDHRFSNIQRHLAILAIGLFTVNIYGLHLPAFISNVPILSHFPTLKALLFLILFIGYLAIIWYYAYPVGRRFGMVGESRRGYIWSNIALSVPVLIPWFIISITADLLSFLPFEYFKDIHNNPVGSLLILIALLPAIAITAPALIQRFWGCQPLSSGVHRDRIESMCKRAKVKYAEILSWPIFGGRMITAGVMGLVNRFRYILVTDALLQNLSFEEIDTVIAHEIGHVKKYHIQLYIFFFLGFLLLWFSIQDVILFILFYNAYALFSAEIIGKISLQILYGVFNIFFVAIFLLYFRYIFGFFVRNFERQADAFVFNLMPSASPLIRSLEKVALTSGQSPDKPNWHHFSISERIRFLKNCETDRRFVQNHDRKVRNSLIAYALVLGICTTAGWSIKPSTLENKLIASFPEKLLILQIEKTPSNPDLHYNLGSVYLAKSKFAESMDSYQRAIELRPHFPEALNNLAWLYATCEDESLRRPSQALKLALVAAELMPHAHILDTLAESYYVNGDFKKALQAGKQALHQATENRDYYLKQVIRFEKATTGMMVERQEIVSQEAEE